MSNERFFVIHPSGVLIKAETKELPVGTIIKQIVDHGNYTWTYYFKIKKVIREYEEKKKIGIQQNWKPSIINVLMYTEKLSGTPKNKLWF